MQSIPSTTVGPSARSPATTRAMARRWSPQLDTRAPRNGAAAPAVRPATRKPSGRSSMATPILPSSEAMARIRSDSFTRSSAASRTTRRALRRRRPPRPGSASRRSPAARARRRPRSPRSGPGPTRRSAIGSPSPSRAATSTRAPMASRTSSAPVRVGLTPTPAHGHRPVRRRRARDEEERGGRDVARHPAEAPAQPAARDHRDRDAVRLRRRRRTRPASAPCDRGSGPARRRSPGPTPRARPGAPPTSPGRWPPARRDGSAGAGRAPAIASGSRAPPRRPTTRAPIRASGSMTRSMGRRRSDSSPVSTVVNGWPARTPSRSRAVVPEFPQSTTSPGSVSPSSPTPWITKCPGPFRVTSAPERRDGPERSPGSPRPRGTPAPR